VGNWNLNSGLLTYKAGAQLLEPHLQSILHWLSWRWALSNYLPRLASNLDSPNLSLPNIKLFFFFLNKCTRKLNKWETNWSRSLRKSHACSGHTQFRGVLRMRGWFHFQWRHATFGQIQNFYLVTSITHINFYLPFKIKGRKTLSRSHNDLKTADTNLDQLRASVHCMMCVQEFVILVFEIFFDSGHTESKPSVVSPQIWQVYCVAMRQNTFFFFFIHY
jgi:hypothetical protein